MSIDLPVPPSPAQPAAGWYPDPQYPSLMRYWDGQNWTGHTNAPVVPPALPMQPAAPARGVAKALTILLGIQIAILAGLTLAAVNFRSEAQQFFDVGSVTNADDVVEAEDLYLAVNGITLLTGLAIAVLLIIWAFKTSKWAQAQGARMRFGPGWAIGAWFIPLANTVLAFMVLNDLHRYAEPGLPRPIANHYRGRSGANQLWGWLVGFISGTVLLNVGTSLVDSIEATEDDVMLGLTMRIIGAGAGAVAVVFLLLYVRATQARVEASDSTYTPAAPIAPLTW
jgi:hypothetical protein